ncbi:T9SS type A sorting domain-containing protein [Psychroflexus montanilacus]|uniref:T9SS type A sorting domain-containing protein n=1 Tax=Psychroflexus montanilacus TaxID=2873598 RepID=UPI001CC95220|nr:T9SS type A sorting domain-containing protein [Psychroflexus montanilacus]MBZ9651618.1 T9SS type A sorting domain-containing protein [Psychroflexus montanilacus]
MNKITFLSLILTLFLFGFAQGQVTQVFTDYEGFWQSSNTSINPIKPENSHNVLGFRFNSANYSTGVNDARLDQNGITYTPANFRALPFNSLPTSGGGSYFIALGQLFDGINNGTNNSATEPFMANMSGQGLTQFLTNGDKGLNLASGFSNIPTTSDFEFRLSTNGINPVAIGDGVPDILVSQIAQPTSTADIARLVDASGNTVGNQVSFNLDSSASPKIGEWQIDFYRLNSTAGITNTQRDIRFRAFDVSDFGITAANVGDVVAIRYTFSGDSDPAFIAYNEESLAVAREIDVVSQPLESDCDGTMSQDFVVQIRDFSGAPVEQAGFAITASIETGPGELLGTVTRITNTSGQATFDDLVFEIGDFHSIRFENTSMEPGISSVVNLDGSCTDSEWNGSFSSEWNNASNWTPTVIPNANFNVLIPSGAPNYPVLQANAGAKNLVMEDDTSINLNGNIFAISGDITLGTNSTVTGSAPGSNLYFSGTDPQTIPNNFIDGDLDILTIENVQGVTNGSASEIVLKSILNVITGDFTTNDQLILACQFNPVRKTAQVAPVGGSITGNVTVEQCFPANRAFRLVTSSVTTSSSSIRQNWQEGALAFDDTTVESGYGTHITGVGVLPGNQNATIDQDGDDGFDYSPSGNPSMFTFDNIGRSWTPIPSTMGDLTAGNPYRLMIRGDRFIDITDNETPPTDTKLRTNGELYTGTLNVSSINPNSGFFSFVGNPYHAQVDMEAVLNASTNLRPSVVYVWDPTVNVRGSYVTVARSAGNWSNNNGGSDATRYLQPMQAVFVETSNLGTAPSVNFSESHKAVSQDQTTVFSENEQEFLQIDMYSQESFVNKEYTLDGLKLLFNENFEEGVQDDFLKLANLDENIARINEGSYVSLEQRPYPKSEELLPLFFVDYKHTNYVLEFKMTEGLKNFKIYVEDNYLDTLKEITPSDDTFNFTVDESIPESKASDRFALVFEPVSLSTPEETITSLSLYPNPTQGNFSISGRDLEQGTELEIYNMIGQQVYKKSLTGQSTIEVTDFNATTGIYLVKLKTNQGEKTFKLIKE